MKKAAALLFVIILILSLAACAPVEKTARGFSMGSDYYINYLSEEEKGGEIGKLLSLIEESFSVRVEGSVLSRINRAEEGEEILLSQEEYEVFSRVFSVASQSDYAFNPAILPLVSLWGFDPPYSIKGEVPPSFEEIAMIKPLVSCENFLLKEKERTVLKKKSGAELDFGGAVKGYAAERVAMLLKESGVKEALVYIGGTIAAVGRNYEIGVTPPRSSEESFALRFTLQEGEICATSGDYERYYIHQGQRYHHILDASTGYPAASGVISATVIAKDGLCADALATACVVLGEEKGVALLEKCGVKGILITSEKKVVLCGVSATIKDRSYEIQ